MDRVSEAPMDRRKSSMDTRAIRLAKMQGDTLLWIGRGVLSIGQQQNQNFSSIEMINGASFGHFLGSK